MNLFMSLYLVVLFVALTPGVLLSLPPKASKMTVVVTHAVIFTAVWYFTHNLVYSMTYEGFQSEMGEEMNSEAAPNANAGMNANANAGMNANANPNATEGFRRKM
jgi:hypothetical protein